MHPSHVRVAYRYLKAEQAEKNVLDGLSRRKALTLVNAVMDKAPTGGFFRDEYWQGIKAVWKALEAADIAFGITKSDYEYESGEAHGRTPIRKVWTFEVPFVNEKGRQEIIYGRVVAGGAGSVDDPLARYDVVAYAT